MLSIPRNDHWGDDLDAVVGVAGTGLGHLDPAHLRALRDYL